MPPLRLLVPHRRRAAALVVADLLFLPDRHRRPLLLLPLARLRLLQRKIPKPIFSFIRINHRLPFTVSNSSSLSRARKRFFCKNRINAIFALLIESR